jgi:hypothetical protein
MFQICLWSLSFTTEFVNLKCTSHRIYYRADIILIFEDYFVPVDENILFHLFFPCLAKLSVAEIMWRQITG